MGQVTKDRRDTYYRKAKDDSYRARSAYKLLQVDDEFSIFAESVTKVIDLCAAPGSWSQVVRRRLLSKDNVKIVAVDLQEMAPIDGVTIIQGDISSRETIDKILQQFQNEKADLIVCDGAPDVTGLHEVDESLQYELIAAAVNVVTSLLQTGGTFVAKTFKGKRHPILFRSLIELFDTVHTVKPASSRTASLEHMLVCRGFRPPPVGMEFVLQ